MHVSYESNQLYQEQQQQRQTTHSHTYTHIVTNTLQNPIRSKQSNPLQMNFQTKQNFRINQINPIGILLEKIESSQNWMSKP